MTNKDLASYHLRDWPDDANATLSTRKRCTRAELGARLEAGRAALKLSTKDMAQRAGIPLSSYREYEGGRKMPGGDALDGFRAAGLNVNWLLSGDGPMLVADLVVTRNAPLNVGVLQEILATMEAWIVQNSATVAASKRAEIVALVYDEFAESGSFERRTVERYLRLVA